MNIVTRKLIAKELYLNRLLLIGTVVGGLVGIGIASFEGTMQFNLGMLLWLTALVAFGVVLTMLSIASERKERQLQFVLSLPLSHGDYIRTKIYGLLICYLLPWLVLSAAAVVLVLVRVNVPDGLLPNAILLCGFMLANFSIVLCGALLVRSEGMMTLLIIATNMGVSVFIFGVSAIPALRDHLQDAQPSWSTEFWIVLAAEAFVLVAACLTPFYAAARRRDFF